MKKLATIILILVLNFINISPVLSVQNSSVITQKSGDEKIIEPNSIIKVQFAHDFNINDADANDPVIFVLPNAITDNDGTIIPAKTKFIGKITSKEDSKWAFRRARANIVIDKMKLPNGKEYYIYSQPKQGELKSPQALNLTKAVGTSAVAGGVCMVGAIVIAIECLSIGGLILAPYTGIAAGVGMSVVSKGLNYKAKAGTPILIKLKEPIAIDLIDSD